MKVKTVTIVGGGSSGWMTAAALSKLCPQLDITLIESETVGTVGVGESTLGHINRFLTMLGLKDEEWMPACYATYKNSIRFTDFREKDGSFFEYPFGDGFDFTDKPAGILAWSDLAALYPDEYTPNTFAEFYMTANTLLAKHNRQTKDENNVLRHFDFKWDTAYHLDAQLFGQYLRDNIALVNNVKHLKGDIKGFEKDSRGKIIKVITEDGRRLESDLWIDCTGFKSIMLEHWMGSQFIPFDKYLSNDRAWACRLPYLDREKEMHNVTDCHAIQNGWVWNIPLWSRIGTGYVYSTRFISPEDAEKEFREHLAVKHSPKIAEEAKMFPVHIRHGKRRRGWVENVIGIGLSYGFVEPLESTGLLTTHENIIKLVDILNRRNGYVTRMEIEGYNLAVDHEITEFRDFVSMHYAYSMRTDTPYWRYHTQIHEFSPDMFNDFQLRQNAWGDLIGNMTRYNKYPDGHTGTLYIASGMGLKVRSTVEQIFLRDSNGSKQEEINFTKRAYEQYRNHIEEHIKRLPTHYQYLKDNIYGGKDDFEL